MSSGFRPHVGLRSLKTALAAVLCALGYALIDRNPTFACIGAIFGLGPDMPGSRLHGGNRLFGTVIGGFIGMGLFWLYLRICPARGSPAGWCCASFCTIPRPRPMWSIP